MAHDDGRRHHSEATPMRTDLRLCVWIGISMRFYHSDSPYNRIYQHEHGLLMRHGSLRESPWRSIDDWGRGPGGA